MKYYYISEYLDFQSIIEKGIISNKNNGINVLDSLKYVAEAAFTEFLQMNFALFEIDSSGVKGEIEVQELETSPYKIRIVQDLIEPEFIVLIGVYYIGRSD